MLSCDMHTLHYSLMISSVVRTVLTNLDEILQHLASLLISFSNGKVFYDLFATCMKLQHFPNASLQSPEKSQNFLGQ